MNDKTNKLYGIIDIGSNSVRLMLALGAQKLSKQVKVTKLAQNLSLNGYLCAAAMDRTMDAVLQFYNEAKGKGAEVFIFATEAMRAAREGAQFAEKIRAITGCKVDVVDGEKEAEIGFYGAYTTGEVCVMDIGGASTEIIIGNKEIITFAKSVKIGSVRLKDLCHENKLDMKYEIYEKCKIFKELPPFDKLIGIGGSMGTIVSVIEQMEVYDSKKVHGYVITKDAILETIEKIITVPMNQRKRISGLAEDRADVIVSSATILLYLLNILNRNEIIASETDNLEGYLKRVVLK